jgi:predicted transcriptional regulator
MSTVQIPDDLAQRLRALSKATDANLDDMVARAVKHYLEEADREALIRRAEDIEAQLTQAGVTEEELAEHFETWRPPAL